MYWRDRDERRRRTILRALEFIESGEACLDDERIQRRIAVTQTQIRGTIMNQCLDQWRTLIKNNDIENIRRIVESDDDRVQLVLKLSPLGVLLSENDRLKIITEIYR